MGKKKLQGADGMNFQLQLTIKGLESICSLSQDKYKRPALRQRNCRTYQVLC